ncbi:MAG: hypothetical protein J5710_10325, partial [Treponema sp.]|nr:hypothetical protein [Treponema sp.]
MKIKRILSKSLFLIFCCFLITNFFSCEGFFSDNGLDEKIQSAIDYAHMPVSECQVSVENGTGTITPLGAKTWKPTDYMNIEFVLDPAYQFLGWSFDYKETIIKEGEIQKVAADPDWWKDYLTIVKEYSNENNGKTTYFLQVKFTKSTDNLIIKPNCSRKPAVDTWEPGDSLSGVPRETQIRIKFDSELSEQSFFYTEDELKQLALEDIKPADFLKKNSDRVYGYKTENGAVFKSIKVTVDGLDCTNCFECPDIETIDAGNKKYSRVSLTPQDALPCPDDESRTAVVTVELYDTVTNNDGASMSATRYSYRINSKPLEYSYVDMSGYNIEEGQPNPGSSRFEFAVSKHISLSFKENLSYQFLYWTTNNENIKFADGNPYLNPTSFYTTVLIRDSDKANIKPVTAVRPKFVETEFKTAYAGTQPRDKDIILTFDKEIVIPEDAKFIISCTGKGDVSSSFEAPKVINGKKIQITAKKDSNRIQVRNGEKLTITVTIPDSLYYVYHDTKTNQDIHVTIGNTVERQPEYEIDSRTQDKAVVTFSSKVNDETCGTINVDNVKKNEEDRISYDIDAEAIINFKANENYEFLYWTTSNTNIEIKDRFSASTTIIAKQFGECSVTAKCAPKLKVIGLRPNAVENPCDSDIYIQTNIKPLELTETGRLPDNSKCNSILSISVNYNGTDVMSSNYEAPKIIEGTGEDAGKYFIYLKSKKKLNAQAAVSNVNVKIDGTFHYDYIDNDGILTEPVEINLVNGNYSGSFGVTENTQKKVYVKFNNNSSHMSFTADPFEAYKKGSVYELNEKTEYNLAFTPTDNWQFVNWNIAAQNNTSFDFTSAASPVSITKTTQYGVDYYKLIVNTANNQIGTSTNPIIISDNSAERLTASLTYPIESVNPRDSSIELTFNKRPDDSILDKIQITCDGLSVKDYFILSADKFDNNNKLTISPNLPKRISVSSGTRDVVITIPASAYYQYVNSTTTANITCGKDITLKYKINETTNDKVIVTYQISKGDNEDSSAGTIKCDDRNVPDTQVTYNMDSVTRTLTFVEKPDYQFLYWETDTPQAFIFEGTDLTSKTIQFTVNKPDSVSTDNVKVTAYCAPRLKITNAEPAKQTTGVERDNDISLTFNVKPEIDIKENIRITVDGNSVNSSFKLSDITTSSFTDNTLKIEADLTNRITVPAGKKTVIVTVDSQAYYKYTAPDGNDYNITLGKDYSFDYIINEKTHQKANVYFKVYDSNESTEITSGAAGTIKCDDDAVSSGLVTYNMDSKTRTLTFTENPDYQFLYWITDNSDAIQLKASTNENKQTTFEPIGEGNNVTIKAVCAPRLKLTTAEPAKATAGVERDNDITLTFNAKPELDIKDKIRITIDGSPVNSSFKLSEIADTSFTGNTLKIEANLANRISVPAGTKKTVVVTVNSDAYYKCTAANGKTYDITLGKDASHEYIINENTNTQAKVTYKVYEGSTEKTAAGTIKCDGVTVPSSQITYNMDSITRTLTFVESDDYQFLYWETDNTSAIELDSETIENSQTTFKAKGEGNNITIKAVCAPRLRLGTNSTPAFNSEGVPCDTGIELYLSQKPELDTLRSSVSIYSNGSPAKDNFPTAGWTLSDTATNGYYILTMPADTTNRISVQSGSKPTVTVTIPAITYYTYTAPNNKTYPVTCGTNQTHEYKINSNTRQQAKVYFKVYDSNGTTEIT